MKLTYIIGRSFGAFLLGLSLTNSALADSSVEPTELALDMPSATYTDDFDGLLKRREIRVLVVYNRTQFFIDKGQPKGLSYEVMDTFIRQLNKKYQTGRLPLKAIYIPVNRDELVEALKEGRGDIAAANLTITERRLNDADFAKPFATNVAEVLVQAQGAKPISNLNELSGADVYVRKVSSYYDSLLKLNKQLEKQNLKPARLLIAPDALEDEDLLQMLSSGLIDNIVVDQHKAELWAKVLPKISVRKDVRLRENGHIAWMLRKNSPKLKAEIDSFVTSQIKGNKDHAWRLVKYLKKTSHLKNTQSTQARQRFERTVEIFKKYSTRYHTDFVLMVAQGYQESGLNQQVRSPVGAIGVMQLMPATGRSLGVGDVRELEPNIHAGIKYIRHITETYFDDPAIDDLNRHLFSFAGYNAGPNRINRLRKVAAQQGLNPNVWHNNVERVVAQKVGREPVNYVANIYAYYVAYTLALEKTGARKDARAGIKAVD